MSSLIALALAGVWALLVFAVSRPFNGPAATVLIDAWRPDLPASAFAWANLAETGWRLASGHAAALCCLAAVFGLGDEPLRILPLGRRVAAADRVAISIGIGAGTAIFLFLGLGVCGLWQKPVGWAVAAAGVWLGWRAFARYGRSKAPGEKGGSALPAGIAAAFGAELLLALAVVAGKSLAWETVFDATAYQLPIPVRFAAEHRVIGMPFVLPSGFPMGGPMLSGWLTLLAGEPAVRAWRVWLVAGTCLLLWRMAAREGSRGAGLVAAALWASMPLMLWLGPATMPDVEISALLLVATLAARIGADSPRPAAWAAACGAIAGAACAVKVQALFLVPALAVACGWLRRGRASRPGLRRATLVAGLAVAGLVPWAWRNACVTGSPVPGYAEGWFRPLVPHPPQLAPDMRRANRAFVIGGPLELPLFPWRISFGGHEATPPGPLFLLAVPCLLLLGPGPAARGYAALAGVAFATWVGVSHNQRYHLATWALLILAFALAARPPGPAPRRGRPAVAVALVACLVAGALSLLRELPGWSRQTACWVLGRDTPAARWERSVPNEYGAAAARAAREVPAGGRILLLEELRGAYWSRPVVFQTHADIPVAELIIRSARSPREAAKRFRQVASWVYESDAEAARLKFRWGYPIFELGPREERIAAELWSGWMDPVFREGPGAVWRVRRIPSPRPRRAGIPLVLDPEALRDAYAPGPSISWDGGARRIR